MLAFQKVGFEVIVDGDEITRKDIPMSEQVAKLTELVLGNHPTFVFSINFFPYISLVCERLGVLYICVTVDCPVAEIYSAEIRNKCNRVFLFDEHQYNEIKDENPDCIFHIPLGVNVERIENTIGVPGSNELGHTIPGNKALENKASENKSSENKSSGKISFPVSGKYDYDVSFVGSLYNEKNPYLSFVREKLSDRMKGYCDGLVAAQMLIPGQEILESGTTAEVISALQSTGEWHFGALGIKDSGIATDTIRKESVASGSAPAKASPLYIRDMSEYVSVNEILSPAVSSAERIETMNYLASKLPEGSVNLFTRSDTSALKGVVCHPGVSSLTEMPQVFRRSKINLNMTIRSIQCGLPQRIWDVLGCHGFLVTNYQSELPEYLEVGKHIAAYETKAELAGLVQYYLEHEDEREEIAHNGYLLVRKQHTIMNTVVAILRNVTGNSSAQ